MKKIAQIKISTQNISGMIQRKWEYQFPQKLGIRGRFRHSRDFSLYICLSFLTYFSSRTKTGMYSFFLYFKKTGTKYLLPREQENGEYLDYIKDSNKDKNLQINEQGDGCQQEIIFEVPKNKSEILHFSSQWCSNYFLKFSFFSSHVYKDFKV